MNNAYKFLRKLSKKDADDVVNEARGSGLPGGYVTDGMGSIYAVPDEGKTPLFTAKSTPDSVRFAYNFKDKTLEVWLAPEKGQPRELLTSYGVSAGDFVDGPEYWASVAYRQVQEDVESELEIERMAMGIEQTQENWKKAGFGD